MKEPLIFITEYIHPQKFNSGFKYVFQGEQVCFSSNSIQTFSLGKKS